MHFVNAKGILSQHNGMNIYRGCTHGCIYCDSRSVCYQMPHDFEDIEVKQNAPELLEQALRRKRNKCMIAVGKNTRRVIEGLSLEEIRSMVPEEWVMRILEEGGVTTDFRSVWLLVFWGRLTRGGMILTPLTSHHMMHLPACLEVILNERFI